MSEEKSTPKEYIIKPFWNAQCQELSRKLPLPTKSDYTNALLKQSNSIKEVGKSWFSTTFLKLPENDSLKTYFPLSKSLATETTQTKHIRVKQIKIYPNETQKEIINKWFGTARFVYNYCIDYFKLHPQTTLNKIKLRDIIFPKLPKWCKSTPCAVKEYAVRDFATAKKNAIDKYKKTKKYQELSYKSVRDNQSIHIVKTSIKQNAIYPRYLKELEFVEKLPDHYLSSRLIKQNNEYYLCVPYESPTVNYDNRDTVVSLDPGIRTFMTFYSENNYGELAKNDISRIYRLLHAKDKLESKMTKEKAKKRYRMKKAKHNIEKKIKNVVNEVHKKSINFLTKNYSNIILPDFQTKHICRKLDSSNRRKILAWSHYKFQTKLKEVCTRTKTNLYIVKEDYTSKTCGLCGTLNDNLRSNKVFKCKVCQKEYDRDINGARNILIKTVIESLPRTESAIM